MTSASKLANQRGPLRMVREHTFVGGQPAVRLACGHTIVTSATHTRRHRCGACLRARRDADARMLRESDSELARQLRRAIGATTAGGAS